MTSKSTGRGFANALILILAVVVALGGAGYYVFSKQKNLTTETSQASRDELEAACKKELADEIFCKFASNWSLDEDYQSIMTSSDTDGIVITTFENQGQDRSKVTSSKNGVEVSAFISIGNTAYVKDLGDNSWFKYSSDAPISEDLGEGLNFDFTSVGEENDPTQYTQIGKDACGLLTCFKYEITDPNDPSAGTTIWFDDADYKLRRMLSATTDATTELSFSYGGVSIEEPTPIKEARDYEDMNPEELQAELEAAIGQYDL